MPLLITNPKYSWRVLFLNEINVAFGMNSLEPLKWTLEAWKDKIILRITKIFIKLFFLIMQAYIWNFRFLQINHEISDSAVAAFCLHYWRNLFHTMKKPSSIIGCICFKFFWALLQRTSLCLKHSESHCRQLKIKSPLNYWSVRGLEIYCKFLYFITNKSFRLTDYSFISWSQWKSRRKRK